MELPGWGTAVGAAVNKITQFIKGPVESAKNEKVRLLNERDKLMSQPYTAAIGNRVTDIDNRVSTLNQIIINNAKD